MQTCLGRQDRYGAKFTQRIYLSVVSNKSKYSDHILYLSLSMGLNIKIFSYYSFYSLRGRCAPVCRQAGWRFRESYLFSFAEITGQSYMVTKTIKL